MISSIQSQTGDWWERSASENGTHSAGSQHVSNMLVYHYSAHGLHTLLSKQPAGVLISSADNMLSQEHTVTYEQPNIL